MNNLFEQYETNQEKALTKNVKTASKLCTEIDIYFNSCNIKMHQDEDFVTFKHSNAEKDQELEVLVFSDKILIKLFSGKLEGLFKEVAEKQDNSFTFNDKEYIWDKDQINILKNNSQNAFVYPDMSKDKLGVQLTWNEEHNVDKTIFLKNILLFIGLTKRY